MFTVCYLAEKGTERERLFEGGSDDVKPRLRTPEEIMAAYGKARVMSTMVLVEMKDL